MIGYGAMAAGPPDAQGGIAVFAMHILLGPLVVLIGAGFGHLAGGWVRKRITAEQRGFEPVVRDAPVDLKDDGR